MGNITSKSACPSETNKVAQNNACPILWILTPTCSQRILDGFGAVADATSPGIYWLPQFLRGAIVVIHQLPATEETLWIRVLGRARTQKRAVEELMVLPENNPYKPNLMRILADWQKNLALRDNLTPTDEEMIMNLSAVYVQQCQEWKQEGIIEGLTKGLTQGLQQGLTQGLTQGLQQGSLMLLLLLLQKRFGDLPESIRSSLETLDRFQLERLAEAIFDFETLDDVATWLPTHIPAIVEGETT